MSNWKKSLVVLKPILIAKIEEAVNEADNEVTRDHKDYFPWIGDCTYEIMADAAIAVLQGIGDSQDFLESEGLLE